MDPHIEDLFEKAPSFFGGEASFHPDYDSCSITANMLEDMMIECFGGKVARLMGEYTAAQFEVERFYALHYFYQGSLAAKAELKQKRPDAKGETP